MTYQPEKITDFRARLKLSPRELDRILRIYQEWPTQPNLQYSSTGATLRYITSTPDFDAFCRRIG